MPRTARLLTPVTLAALLLAGCTPSTPMPAPPPTPDATPVFASDEEALAAAEEAYGKYLAMVATVLADGGRDPERLKPFLTHDLFLEEVGSYADLRANGWHGVGSYSFEMSPQRLDLATGDLDVYVCDDRSALEIVDANGNSVVSPDRPDRAASQVTFVWQDKLVIASQIAWEGSGIC